MARLLMGGRSGQVNLTPTGGMRYITGVMYSD
jgi:hypothetical protein